MKINIYGKPRKPSPLAPLCKEALDPPTPQGEILKDSEWARIYFLPNDYFHRHNDHKLVQRCSQMTTKCVQRYIFMLSGFLVLFYAHVYAIPFGDSGFCTICRELWIFWVAILRSTRDFSRYHNVKKVSCGDSVEKNFREILMNTGQHGNNFLN